VENGLPRDNCAFAETCGSTSPLGYPPARSTPSRGFDMTLRTALCMQQANPNYKAVGANNSLDDEDILLPIPFKKFPYDRRAIPLGWRQLEDDAPLGFQLIGGDACIIERETKEQQYVRGMGMVMRRVLVALPDWALDFRRIRALVDLPGKVRNEAQLATVHTPIRYSDMEWTVIPIDFPVGEALIESTEGGSTMKEACIKNILFSLMQSVLLLADNMVHFYGLLNPSTLFLDRRQKTLQSILPLGAMLSSTGAGSISMMVHQSHGFTCAPEMRVVLQHSNVQLLRRLGAERDRALAVDAYAAAAVALWCFGEKEPSLVHKHAVASQLPMLARDLLQKALFPDPDWRLSGSDILRHSWLKGCQWM